jgi:septal ring factor EnvC (AmiA/AmiB activator)
MAIETDVEFNETIETDVEFNETTMTVEETQYTSYTAAVLGKRLRQLRREIDRHQADVAQWEKELWRSRSALAEAFTELAELEASRQRLTEDD